MVDHNPEKLSALAVIVIWAAIATFGPFKFGSTDTVKMTKPLKYALGFLTFYFVTGALANTFTPPVWGSTNETWSPINMMFPTFFLTTSISFFFIVRAPAVPVWTLQTLLFMVLYNARNDIHYFTGIGCPDGPSPFVYVDAPIVFTVLSIVLWQYFAVLPKNGASLF